MIHHLIDGDTWASARLDALLTPGSLAAEGFVHCCTDSQIRGVIERYYADVANLWVLDVDEGALPDGLLRWEPPIDPRTGLARAGAGAETYPHLYGPIPVPAVVAATPWAERSGY